MEKITSLEYLTENWNSIVTEAFRITGVYIPSRISLTIFTRKSESAGKAGHNAYLSPADPYYFVEINGPLFQREENLPGLHNTVLHELCHVLAHKATGKLNHGKVWRSLMIRLGEAPERCHTLNSAGLGKTIVRHPVACQHGCTYRVTTRKLRKLEKYRCKIHGLPLDKVS